MRLNRKETNGVLVLEINGKILGGEESEGLVREIDRLVESRGKALILNLKEVPWMNSSGLGILLAGFIRLRNYGGELKFLHANERVMGILVTTKLVDILEVYDDESEAIESFSKEGSEAGDRS